MTPDTGADDVYRVIYGVVLDERAAVRLLGEVLARARDRDGDREPADRDVQTRRIAVAVDMALAHAAAGGQGDPPGPWRGTDPVRWLLAPLTPGMRAMFVLRRYVGLGAEEVATMLGVGDETVRVQISMAMELMRDGVPARSAATPEDELDRDIVDAVRDGLDAVSPSTASRARRIATRVRRLGGAARRRLMLVILTIVIVIAMGLVASTLAETYVVAVSTGAVS